MPEPLPEVYTVPEMTSYHEKRCHRVKVGDEGGVEYVEWFHCTPPTIGEVLGANLGGSPDFMPKVLEIADRHVLLGESSFGTGYTSVSQLPVDLFTAVTSALLTKTGQSVLSDGSCHGR